LLTKCQKIAPKKSIVHNPFFNFKVPLWDFLGKTAQHQPRAASSTSESTPNNNKGHVTRTVALPFYIKKYLKAKEGLWKFKYFTMQKYNLKFFFKKNPSKRNQILQDIIIL
jgi:hypothetical protein